MTEHDQALETPDIRANTLSDCRNVMLMFVESTKTASIFCQSRYAQSQNVFPKTVFHKPRIN
jgi:hypothetical protein